MKRKEKIIIPIIILFFIIAVIFIIYINIKITYTKENGYIGHVEVYFHDNTTYERIYEIIEDENLSIIKIENINDEVRPNIFEKNILVYIRSPTWKEGEEVKNKLEKYPEIDFIILYKDL